jgi:hypothetical protein
VSNNLQWTRFWLALAVLAWLAGVAKPAAATPHTYCVCFEIKECSCPADFSVDYVIAQGSLNFGQLHWCQGGQTWTCGGLTIPGTTVTINGRCAQVQGPLSLCECRFSVTPTLLFVQNGGVTLGCYFCSPANTQAVNGPACCTVGGSGDAAADGDNNGTQSGGIKTFVLANSGGSGGGHFELLFQPASAPEVDVDGAALPIGIIVSGLALAMERSRRRRVF